MIRRARYCYGTLSVRQPARLCQIKSKSNQIKIYIAPYVHEDSEALGGWITCSRRVGIDEFLNVF